MAGKNILIVEDNQLNLKLMNVILSIEGYHVKSATNAESALLLLKTYKPEFILMDIQLPGMDGLQLTRILKKNPHTSDIIIIAITAYAMKGDEEKVMNAGCNEYIAKPIDRVKLLKLIAKHC